MKEKEYIFSVEAKVIYVGNVYATSKEEAIQKCKNNNYYDIFDQYESKIDWTTLNIDNEIEEN